MIDGGALTMILLGSILGNYIIARFIYSNTRFNVAILVFGILINLLPLLYFKYGNFLINVVSDLSNINGVKSNLSLLSIALPAGISFYTFHAISYLVDVYAKKVKPATSLVDFGMYMANFPQLIAGPIVRYYEVVDVVRDRKIKTEQVYTGFLLFIIGLSKKIILADSLGSIADSIFALPHDGVSTSLAWIGLFAYTLQIYFDFSGYSDMAIGMGRMMGFEFPQNFNQPYRSTSVTEFWKRWHMTLSRWFRDYLYIPLGGNREGNYRTFINLFVVFFLCGLWHGAAYSFIIWGIYHGVLLIIERILLSRYGFVTSGWIGQSLTFLLVMIGWVFFRSSSLSAAIDYLAVMASLSPSPTFQTIPHILSSDKITFILIASLCAFFPIERIQLIRVSESFKICAQGLLATFLLLLSCAFIAANGFNPFIYFRF